MPTISPTAGPLDNSDKEMNMFSSKSVIFHLSYILGIFPARLTTTSTSGGVFTFSLLSASVPLVVWICLHVYVIHPYISRIGSTSFVDFDCNTNRGPDYIYDLIDCIYPVQDFVITLSAFFLARELAPALNHFFVSWSQLEDGSHIKKPTLLTRPFILSFLSTCCYLLWNVSGVIKAACGDPQHVQLKSVLDSSLVVLMSFRTYAGIVSFYDTLFLHVNNCTIAAIKHVRDIKDELILFEKLTFLEGLLENLQTGFGAYLLFHLPLLVLFNIANTYFIIIILTLTTHYRSLYKLLELVGLVAVACHIWLRILYICSAGNKVCYLGNL